MLEKNKFNDFDNFSEPGGFSKVKVLLISGFATELKIPLLSRDLSRYRGFNFLSPSSSLDPSDFLDINFFRWGEVINFSLLDSLNLIAWLSLFKREQKMTDEKDLQNALAKEIIAGKYDIIVCHSLGARLFLNTLKNFVLPCSKVYFIQACVNIDKALPSSSNLRGCITNIYCPWDPSLIINTIVSLEVASGLFKSKNTKNKFWPLYKTANLHVSSINDQNLLRRILSGFRSSLDLD